MWSKEVIEIRIELQKDARTKMQKLAFKNWKAPDVKLSEFFIRKYLERTSLKYVLAFI